MTYANQSTAPDTAFSLTFNAARAILRSYSTGRMWHRSLQNRFALHPIVRKIVHTHMVRPVDWQRLLLEWPHVSIDDATQIAYTRSEEDAERDRQIRTSIGKYLARHWPHVPDHIRRDWAGAFGQYTYAIWDTIEDIIAGVELGPQSCMKSTYGSIPFRDNESVIAWFNAGKPADNDVEWDDHPYCVYSPDYGWRMAVRYCVDRPDTLMGRCLVNEKSKAFVRSYKRHEDESGYSHTDERLEAWLREQGYNKAYSWEGHKLAQREHPRNDGILVPYIDGECKTVSLCGMYLRITEDGRHTCNNTDGTADRKDSIGECEDCGETVYEDDDRIWAGRDEDRLVCECCAENYTYVRGNSVNRRGYTSYYIPSEDAVEVDGENYDPDNLPSSIVCCADGEYRPTEDCAFCADDEYRPTEDCVECADGEWRPKEDCVECADGEWRPKEDCVKCADGKWRPTDECWESEAGNWYGNDEAQVEVDGGTYHPDELRDMADNA